MMPTIDTSDRQIEATLMNCPMIADCVVLSRPINQDSSHRVAYFIPNGPVALERLRNHCAATLPEHLLPSHFVPMYSFPRKADGQIDRAALVRTALLDSELNARWESSLSSRPEISQAVVITEDTAKPLPALHITDVAPGLAAEFEASERGMDILPMQHGQDAGEALAHPGAMAFSDGGPLDIPVDAPVTFRDALYRTACAHKNSGIVYVQPDGSEDFQSYAQLLQDARRMLAGFYNEGLRSGDRVVLQIDNLRSHFTAFWACVLGGITPVAVAVAGSYQETNGVVNKLFNIWKLLGQPPLITSTALAPHLAGLDKILPMPGLRILTAESLLEHEPTDRIFHGSPDDLLFFQLTSGSTGVPKCIQETHGGVISHIHSSAQFNGYTSDDVSFNWLPMDHVVPILTYHLKDVYLGCKQVQVKTDMVLSKPLMWLDCIQSHRVTHTWSPNFGFKLLSDALAKSKADKRWDLSSIKYFMNAGEQVTLPVVRDFLESVASFGVRPDAMQPAFGMAEVCTCMTYRNQFDLESGVHRVLKSSLTGVLKKASNDESQTTTFVDLGGPTPGVQIRIADGQNKLLPEGVIGRLQIRGPVVTPGYFRNDDANREAFVGEGWFNSGDLGFILGGRLAITGREKEMIIIRGANFYCYEIEDVVNRTEGVEPTFVAACAVADSETGSEGLAIFFVPKNDGVGVAPRAQTELLKTIKARVTASMGITPAFVIPLRKKEFPKTTSGKIQRSQLKKSLEAGAFKAQIKQTDILLESPRTLPDWFFIRRWMPRSPGLEQAEPDFSGCLIFSDKGGIGAHLFSLLARRGYGCVTVEAGTAFRAQSMGTYSIDPANPAHYQMLLESISRENRKITRIIHLWAHDPVAPAGPGTDNGRIDQAQTMGTYSLLFLAQALARTGGGKSSIRLLGVTRQVQAIEQDRSLAVEHCTIAGLLKTIPSEMPWLDCKHIDLAQASIDESATALLTELALIRGEREVAYRNGARFSPVLEKLDLASREKQAIPIKNGGLYLISGGLGGIGSQLARYLLKQHHARVLILGRTALPERDEWHGHLKQNGAQAEKLRLLLELEALPGEVLYNAADICDAGTLKRAVELARLQFGGAMIDGIFHLAAVFEEHFLIEETRESFAATLRPKVEGTVALASLLDGNQDALFVGFSTVNSLFGGATVGAYASANSFLDGFMAERIRNGYANSYCIAWSPWDETGMSRGYQMKSVSRSRGYYSLQPRQGINSLVAALQSRQPDLVIGLDAANANIRQCMDTTPHIMQSLHAYVTLNPGSSPPAMSEFNVHDVFGVRSECELSVLGELPVGKNGEVDRTALLAATKAISSERVEPRNEFERKIAAVWQDALGVQNLGIHDNFFELGGHSLLATQMIYKLQDQYKIELPLRCLFNAPTIAGLAAAIDNLKGQGLSTASPAKITPEPRAQFEPFPLTDIQQAYWIGRTGSFALGNVGCHVYTEVDFPNLDLGRLYGAINTLIKRHGMLRAVIGDDGRQQIQEHVEDYRLKILDLRGLDAATAGARLLALREQMSHEVLPANRAPMLEVCATQMDRYTRLHCSVDLLISDARSFQILLEEASQLYQDPELVLPPLELSFRDYVLNEAALRESEGMKRAREYWMSRLETLPPAPDLPMVKNPASVTRPRFVRRSLQLVSKDWNKLKALASRAGLTTSGILAAALAEVLAVWNKGPRLTINLTLFNRLPLHSQVNEIVGDFTSSTLLAVDRAAAPTLEGRARRMQEQLWRDLDHRSFSGVQVLRELSRIQGAPVFMPVVFTSILDLPNSGRSAPELLNNARFIYSITQTPQVWLDNQVYEYAGGLVCNWDAVEELFPIGLLDDMFAAYSSLVEGLARDEKVWQASWADVVRNAIPEAQLNLRRMINATHHRLPEGLLHSLFSAQASRRPDSPAVINGDETLTYHELELCSNRIARLLQRAGARPNKLIAIVLEKGWEQVAAVLGILKSGAAYLPIDPDVPAERLAFLMQHAGATLALTEQRLFDRLKWPEEILRLCIDDGRMSQISGEPLEDVQEITDLAYVIYTSGSTGQPKGVAIDHRGAVNTVLDVNRRFGVAANDRVLALSALNFDLSVYDIFGLLAVGGAVVIPQASKMKDPAHWVELVERHQVTIWNSVPALMQLAIQHSEYSNSRLESIRLVMMSGDWIPVALPARIRALLPSVKMYSLGGATEASIWSILYPIETVPADWKSIPYGRPMLNQTFHVFNETMEPTPVWVPGQLYIGGIGLALGYWNDEEKTARAFILHPKTGERLYRTGDLGRYLPDGNIEFLGREDFQVKINGYRIELGEIECVLEQNPQVQNAVLIAASDENGQKRLVAYVVPREAVKPTADDLRAYLKTKLPEYMIPAVFSIRETLPLTSNGKVDRRALPALEVQQPVLERKYVPPRNAVEEVLAGILAEILGHDRVGVYDNFFELGGHSLLAIQFVSRLRDTFEYEPPPISLFETPTVASLAALMVSDPLQRPAVEKTAELLLSLSAIPDDDVEAQFAGQIGGI